MSRNPQAASILLHVALLAVILLWRVSAPEPEFRRLDVIHLTAPPIRTSTPGMGGGSRQDEPPKRGVLPPKANQAFIPPTLEHAKATILPVVMTLDTPPEMRFQPGAIGDPNGFGTLSAGPGGPAGIGFGDGNRIGKGAGDQSGTGEGVYSLGSVTTGPVVIKMVEPEYSENARRARLSGSVCVYAEIGTDGRPHNLKISRGLGLGLDEKAMQAVSGWVFKPGLKDGRPVIVRATFEVNFRLL